MSTDSGRVFDDDIPDFVRRACGNYLVEYCGEYRTQGKLWDVCQLPRSYDRGLSNRAQVD